MSNINDITVPLSWFIFVIVANVLTILVAAVILLYEGKRLAKYYRDFRTNETALNARIKSEQKARHELAEVMGRIALAKVALQRVPLSTLDTDTYRIISHATKSIEAPLSHVD